MSPLNLPQFNIRLRQESDASYTSVFDPLRAKWVKLTPEEWVRQHFVNYLIEYKGFPQSRMANEVSIRLNNTLRRCDTVVYDSSLRHPLVIIEYKAPEIQLTQQVFDQIVRYNMVLQARYLIVSNGLTHYCCQIDYTTRTYRFLPQIPAATQL